MVRLTKVPEERVKAVRDALQTDRKLFMHLNLAFFFGSYLQQFPQLTSLSAIRIFFVFYADKSSEATLA